MWDHFIKPYPKDCYQSQLFPDNVFDLLPEDHECFLYRELFQQMDRSDVEAHYSWQGQRAWPPYVSIVSILIYDYSHAVFNSRRSASATERIRGPVHCGVELAVLPAVERF